MSILKNILSPFIEFNEEKKENVSKENKPQEANNNITTAPNETPAVSFTTNADINVPLQTFTPTVTGGTVTSLPEHQKHFDNLIEEANAKNPIFQGTDYKEFIDAKADIDAISDEETKYKTAFSVLKRTGLTKEKLISTGQEYINIIGRDLNTFQSNYSQQYQKEVKQRELLIQKKAEELQALRERIAAVQAEIKQLSTEATQAKDKLDVIRNSFLLAGENKQKEIYNELQKIAKYF